MWQIKAIRKGKEIEIPYLSVDLVDVTAEVVRNAASKFAKEEDVHYPAHLLDREVDKMPLPGRDAIQFWGEQAVGKYRGKNAEYQESIRMFEERALTWFGGKNNDELRAAAWHDRTFVIIPLTPEDEGFVVEYKPEEEEEEFTHLLSNNFGSELQHQVDLELRGYIGEQSTVIDAIFQLGHSVRFNVCKGTGIIVGLAANWLGKPKKRYESDPFWLGRIAEQSKCYPKIVELYPDLKDVDTFDGECVIIFIHGTFSCGIGSLNDLDNICSSKIYRFEHDTFLSIENNASELVKLITEKTQNSKSLKRLLFTGHSRGGLVARLAAVKVSQTLSSILIKLWTFGTPHVGTPIAAAASETLALLYKAGAMLIDEIPIPNPLNAAASYLIKAKQPPIGISQMQQDSQFYEALNFYAEHECLSFAGDLTVDNFNKNQYVIAGLQGFSLTAFGAEKNDSVVTVKSAEYGKNSITISGCSHFNYFKQEPVQIAFQNFCEFDYLLKSEIEIFSEKPVAEKIVIKDEGDCIRIGFIKIKKGINRKNR